MAQAMCTGIKAFQANSINMMILCGNKASRANKAKHTSILINSMLLMKNPMKVENQLTLKELRPNHSKMS
jgi:hypothetical protein